VTGSAPTCWHCPRPGILICQKVIPNQWSESEKAHVFKPWVFRSYLCRWHLAAGNSPRHWDYTPGRKRVRVELLPDAVVIQAWNETQKALGVVGVNGWQMPSVQNIKVTNTPAK
jgi:hypothetical protein